MENGNGKYIVAAAFFIFSVLMLFSFSHGRNKNIAAFGKLQPSAAAIPALTGNESVSPPETSADSLFVKRMKTGQVFLAKNEKTPRPIASLTKLMTAVIFSGEKNVNEDWIYLSADSKKTEEKMSKVFAGELMLGRDALKFLLIESDNDIALALAEFVGKKRGAVNFPDAINYFVGFMNEKAGVIGLKNTHFANPSGLDNEENFSSAVDISLLIDYIQNNYNNIWDITRIPETVIFTKSKRSYRIVNTNDLLKEFPAIIGGKTGFTDEAKGALVIVYALRPDDLISIVILGSRDRFGDGRKIIQWLEEKYNQ